MSANEWQPVAICAGDDAGLGAGNVRHRAVIRQRISERPTKQVDQFEAGQRRRRENDYLRAR